MTISDIDKIEVKSVKQLSAEMKTLLEEKFPYIWVKGELGPVKVHSSGHTYFSLKEDDTVINAISWRGTPLSAKLIEGSVVECYGRITIYPGRSSYQIIVKEAREINKQGDIFTQLEELKKKLQQEGIFDLDRKKSLPQYPEKIGILTSPTGAVLHDIMHRITNRFPCCQIYFFPISVQGADSQQSILDGLEKADNFQGDDLFGNKLDLIILARGGGSIEDLWIFNDEQIVRKVANMKTPIITAIGHETDTTLVDYASDLRAPTPTAAAELGVPDKTSIQNSINNRLESVLNFSNEKVNQIKEFLINYSDYNYIYNNALGNFGQKIDNLILNFISTAQEKLAKNKAELGKLEANTQIFSRFKEQIEQYAEKINTISQMRINDAKNMLIHQQSFLDEKEAELKEKVMIADSSNNRIISAKDLRKLDEFTLKFFDGNVKATPKEENS